MGIGADMDWLIGSDEAPELKFSPVEFDPDKFTADVMADPPPRKSGKSETDEAGEWVDGNKPGDQQENPEMKDGEGLPDTGKKKEDLKKLPDEQKYMRSLDEMSKLEKADPKPTFAVAKAKAAKVKSKYALDTITVTDKGDLAEVYVKHAKENNKKHLLEVPLMSAAERYKLLKTAMDDLNAKNAKAGGEAGTVTEDEAKELISSWQKAHPVVEEAHVVDGGVTWDYFIDIGDKSETEKGNKKKGSGGFDHTIVKDDFELKSGDKHKLYLRETAAGFDLIMESTPTVYQNFINKFVLPPDASDEQKAVKQSAIDLAIKIETELDTLTKSPDGGLGNTNVKEGAKELEFDQWLDQLSDLTVKLMDLSYGTKIPGNQAVWGAKFDDAFGTTASINYLSTTSTGKQSSSKKYEKHGILDSRRGDSGERPYYLRGHLINGNLHGPDDWKNLTPLTYKANTAHKDKIETELTKHLTPEGSPISTDQRAFKYIVIAQYGRGVNSSAKSEVDKSKEQRVIDNADVIKKIIDAEAFVPRHLEIKAIELKPNAAGDWVEEKVVFNDKVVNDIDQSPESYVISGKAPDFVNFSTATEGSLEKWFESGAAKAILRARRDPLVDSWTNELIQEKAKKFLPEGMDGKNIRLDSLKKHIKIE